MLKEPLYRHRQLPLWFALMMVAFIGYGVFILLIIDSKQVFWLWSGFTILLAVFFWGLAVEVNQDEVRLSFGIGLIKKNDPAGAGCGCGTGAEFVVVWLGYTFDTTRLDVEYLRSGCG